MKTDTNKLALARKVFERSIKQDQTTAIYGVFYRELKKHIRQVKDSLSSLAYLCDEIDKGLYNNSVGMAVIPSWIADVRERLANVNRNVKAYCKIAEAINTATVADNEEKKATRSEVANA